MTTAKNSSSLMQDKLLILLQDTVARFALTDTISTTPLLKLLLATTVFKITTLTERQSTFKTFFFQSIQLLPTVDFMTSLVNNVQNALELPIGPPIAVVKRATTPTVRAASQFLLGTSLLVINYSASRTKDFISAPTAPQIL